MITLMLISTFLSNSTPAHPCANQRTTIEINDCGARIMKQKESELEAAYKALLARLVPVEPEDRVDYQAVKQKLDDAQRHWRMFREHDCSAKYELNIDGTIRNSLYLDCLIEHTEQRTRALLKWMDD
ncbi:DUF1311 domain-containing protein [Burkholderiaceae bacterium DAT-1]|nr:DUF1311 domain-containing protein [Burkholderiaceae bacterium DAT-1]